MSEDHIDDVEDLDEGVEPEVSPVKQANYTPDDAHRDFVQVFSTEQGQRVLRQIMTWGHHGRANISVVPSADPHLMFLADGERNLACKILSAVTEDPKAYPVKGNTRPRTEPRWRL